MIEQPPPFTNETVKMVYDTFPDKARAALLTIRFWIFEIAESRTDVGTILEEVKWGQPSYATRPKTGCPLRLGRPKHGESCALYVPCQTSLIQDLRAHYDALMPQNLQFEGSRGIHFDPNCNLPEAELKHAITLALTYYSKRQP